MRLLWCEIKTVIVCVAAALLLNIGEAHAGPEEGYLKTAQIIYRSAIEMENLEQIEAFSRVRAILDKIVEDYPASDTAVLILLEENIGGLDVAALDKALEGPSAVASSSRTGRKVESQAEQDYPSEVLLRIGPTVARVDVRRFQPDVKRYVIKTSFDPKESIPAEYADARDAPKTKYRVVVSPGATNWQILSALGSVDFVTGNTGTLPDEGMLAPGTYEIQRGGELSDLILRMRSLQNQRLEGAWNKKSNDLPLENKQEALVLASIVEKETSNPEERRRIASVLLNRLKLGIRLQTDSTVIYGITQGRQLLGRGLRQGELSEETPWNTYIIDGLPPTAISNPSNESIEAVLNPEDTDFIFFVANGLGGHAFARTLAEHNENVRKWRRVEGNNSTNNNEQNTVKPVQLSKSERVEVQRRLSLLGFGTRGIDGIFGPGTRSAITAWQETTTFAPTGELTPPQLERLRSESEEQYREWQKRTRANSASARTASQPKRINVGDTYYQVKDGIRYRCKRLAIGNWCSRVSN